MSAFTFDLRLGGVTVKRVNFPNGNGRRELRTSTGLRIGQIVLRDGTLRVEMDDYTAQALADANFH